MLKDVIKTDHYYTKKQPRYLFVFRFRSNKIKITMACVS